ncbi:MAG: hypothetical protein K0U98_04855 [Deltaproteobacteria bacterium]|nr:hypothetical protein [Deltaproteobacteria bacterium]
MQVSAHGASTASALMMPSELKTITAEQKMYFMVDLLYDDTAGIAGIY